MGHQGKVLLNGTPPTELAKSVILCKAASVVSQFGLVIKITAVYNFGKWVDDVNVTGLQREDYVNTVSFLLWLN